MKNEWFQTWNRPEYLEWAKVISEGYLLHIIRKESKDFLVVEVKLIMGEAGLPGFEVIKQVKCISQEEAMQQIQQWDTQETFV